MNLQKMNRWFWWKEPQAHGAGNLLDLVQAWLRAVSLQNGRRRVAESRSGRDLEAEVSNPDFVSSAVGSPERRQDLIDIFTFFSRVPLGALWRMDNRRRGEVMRLSPGIFIMEIYQNVRAVCVLGQNGKSLHVSVSNFPSA